MPIALSTARRRTLVSARFLEVKKVYFPRLRKRAVDEDYVGCMKNFLAGAPTQVRISGLLDTSKLVQKLDFKPMVSISNDKPRLKADPGSRLRRAGLTAFGDFLSTANNEQILAIKLYSSLPHGLHLQSSEIHARDKQMSFAL